MSALTRVHTPEEHELACKQADIDRLNAQLADRELELETLRAIGPCYRESSNC